MKATELRRTSTSAARSYTAADRRARLVEYVENVTVLDDEFAPGRQGSDTALVNFVVDEKQAGVGGL